MFILHFTNMYQIWKILGSIQVKYIYFLVKGKLLLNFNIKQNINY